MGWLDRFLHNTGKIGEDAKDADSKIQEVWKKYFDSVHEKEIEEKDCHRMLLSSLSFMTLGSGLTAEA